MHWTNVHDPVPQHIHSLATLTGKLLNQRQSLRRIANCVEICLIGWTDWLETIQKATVAQIPTAYKSQGTISNHTRPYLEAVHVLDSHLIRFT